jgi:cell envelope opacity-associated protein A
VAQVALVYVGPGQHDAPTQASAFNRAVQEAAREAFAAADRAEHSASEETTCSVSEDMVTSPVTVPTPASDVSVSSVARTGGMVPSRGAPCTTTPGRRVLREDSLPSGMAVCRAMVSTDPGDPRNMQAASGAAVGATQPSIVKRPHQAKVKVVQARLPPASPVKSSSRRSRWGTHNWLQ